MTGGLVSLPAVTIANLTHDKSEYGTRMGMGYTVAAIGALVGNPIAGAAKRKAVDVGGIGGILGDEEIMRRWQGAWFVAGSALVVATVLMAMTRVKRVGWNLRAKL